MKRSEAALAAAGVILLVAAAAILGTSKAGETRKDFALEAGSCRVPMTHLSSGESREAPNLLVIHGLSASRGLMLMLGEALVPAAGNVYLLDLPGHGDNTQPFTFSRAEECAREAVWALLQRGEIELERTVFLGHSMGAAIAIRLADYFPAAATIAVSPAPMVELPRMPAFARLPFAVPRRMPSNLLILMAQLDPPPIRPSGEKLFALTGGERVSAADFAAKRAAQLVTLRYQTHSSIIFAPGAAKLSSDWIGRALARPGKAPSSMARLIVGGVAGLAGIGLLFPALASLLCGSLDNRYMPKYPGAPLARTALWWLAAGCAAAVVLMVPGPDPRLLGIYSGDYLCVYLLIAGGIQIPILRMWSRSTSSGETVNADWRAMLGATTLGLSVTLAVGAWLNWQLADMWLSPQRWTRFAPVLFLTFPYFVAEERALGPPASGAAQRLRRFGAFIVLRFMLWLPMILGIVVLGSGQILLFLLAVPFLLVSIFHRLGADAVRRRTGSAWAAVVFGSIVVAWFICGFFPLF